MAWFFLEIKENTIPSPSLQPYFLPDQPPPASQNLHSDGGFNLNDKVSPSILLIIIILAIIFFVSGLLHLLVRFLLRPPSRDPEDIDNVTALQGQLQQLFHLHDAGVDQSFIDTLPVFYYKAIIGLKTPFDCAVCLCEFEPEDKLRLLPKCSHAFHMECIDTWLLSHSTCPLCRASLLPDFSSNNSCSPIVLVLESGSESSREIVADRESGLGRTSSVLRTSSHLGCHGDSEFGSSHFDYSNKSGEILTKEDAIAPPAVAVAIQSGEKVVPVKLGKYRNVDGGECSDNKNIDARRCFSMGSFEYVMDENSLLQVPIRTPVKKQYGKKPSLPLKPGYRPAMSEYDCESRRGFSGFDTIRGIETISSDYVSTSKGNALSRIKNDSLSISKIWLRGKKEKQNLPEDSSRRAFSFRFPVNRNVAAADGDMKSKNGNVGARRTKSEIGIGMWENGGSELGCDEENQSCASMDSLAKTPSFARRTLLWLVGRQNKVVHSSFTPNI
ncbi:hypothetical protein ACOSP7_012661 [Xanthoceras sorbifolium]|uniref:RING-type E3 ubiquitin transferase n=1 Tax=Xanthoceras sorbifolium TaxID=99658 RepID=A0ABQ8HY61_9ROSI|nr:hypothetical protein JRO89_XS06G0140500 [Xanthoceras sorbifolium]